MLAKLTTDLPTVTWLKGRLNPYMASGTQTLGAVSTLRRAGPGQRDQSSIILQVFLPCVADPENITVANMADPATIEDLVDSILTSLLTACSLAPVDYWFFQPVAVTTPQTQTASRRGRNHLLRLYTSLAWH
jgi:hypothetical protein